jgi:hypothetical protein
VPIGSLQDALNTLEERHDVDVEVLSNHVRENFNGSMLSLRQLEPIISEILRRFKHLPRKIAVNGEYPTIAGHRTFKSWCDGVLHRTPRAVRYMLAGGNKKRQTSKQESVSPLDAVAILNYLDRHVSKLDKTQRRLLSQGISQLLTRLEGSIQHE